MPLIERSEAQQLLNSHLNVISNSISSGVDEYFSMYSDEARSRHRPTTRANIIHDHIIDRAKRGFDLKSGTRHHDSRGLSLFVLDERFLLRFKKLNDDKVSRNQKTNQVQAFRQQQKVLDGIETLYNIEAGYVFNELEQGIQSIFLVCPNGRGIYWDIDLADTEKTSSVTDLFSQDNTEKTSTIFTPKRDNKIVTLNRSKEDEHKN